LSLLCDVTKIDDVKRALAETEKWLESNDKKLWAVVNNAGIAPLGALDWLSSESIKKTMDVNYFGLVSVTQLFIPLLKKTKNSRIINVSSAAGLTGLVYFGAYCGFYFIKFHISV
jgi:NAD(P)-dependent dehydrogenase (short-subunit alcohol dehydrogenase family)